MYLSDLLALDWWLYAGFLGVLLALAIKRDTSAGRFYDIDGRSYPSVTHILSCLAKPALIVWSANVERELVRLAAADVYQDAAKLTKPMSREAFLATLQARLGLIKAHQRENEKAKNIGSQTHHLIEHKIREALGQVVGPEPRVCDEALWAYMAFQDWCAAHQVRPLAIEQVVWSHTHGYAGTMDLLATVDGKTALVDFKTSAKAVYPEALLQNVAYQVALTEMGHQRPEVGYVVRLPKNTDDPAFEVVTVPPVEELFPTFLAVLQVWQWWWQAEQASKAAWAAKRGVAA